MDAIHVCHTLPRVRSEGKFYMEDFDILTLILSALKWREKNGEIKLITDSVGKAYFEEIGIIDIWNDVDTSLDSMPDNIDTDMFWAAGKLFALKNCKAPVAVLDNDFIVWDKIAVDNLGDLSVIHTEDLYPDVYPDIHSFNMKIGYIFNPDFDWRVRPANAAFYVMKSQELLDTYTSDAIEFMENSLKGDNLTYMVFAEQRLLSMTAKRLGIEMMEFSNLDKLFKDGERYFTHTWGMKQQMRDIPELRFDFCSRCRDRIKRDFPDYAELVERI